VTPTALRHHPHLVRPRAAPGGDGPLQQHSSRRVPGGVHLSAVRRAAGPLRGVEQWMVERRRVRDRPPHQGRSAHRCKPSLPGMLNRSALQTASRAVVRRVTGRGSLIPQASRPARVRWQTSQRNAHPPSGLGVEAAPYVPRGRPDRRDEKSGVVAIRSPERRPGRGDGPSPPVSRGTPPGLDRCSDAEHHPG
jgi:hypothetical protein